MNEQVKKNNKFTIVFLIVLFISPLLLSWYVFNYTDFIEMRGTSNHGDLILPPRPVEDLSLIDPFNSDRNDTLHGKWSLVYVSAICDARCMENVYRMRQIHLAMDKHSLRVQKVLLLSNQNAEDLKEQLSDFKGQQIINNELVNVNLLVKQFQLSDMGDPLKAGRLYIIDPLGNLMMSFMPETDFRDIYDDLKKLLRGSRIG